MSVEVTVKLSDKNYQTFLKFAELSKLSVPEVLNEILESASPNLAESVEMFTGIARTLEKHKN